MAKQRSFEIGEWYLGSGNVKGVAYAVRPQGATKQRVCLHVPRKPEEAARNALRVFLAGLEDSKGAESRGDPTIGAVLDAYVARLQSERRVSASGAVSRAKRLQPSFGSVRCSELTKEMCRAFAVEMERREFTVHTIHTTLNFLRAALNWAYGEKISSTRASLYAWNIAMPATTRTCMAMPDVRAFLAAAAGEHEHIRLLALIILFTSQRPGAVLSLRWDQVDLEAGTIDFRIQTGPRSVLDKGYVKGRAMVVIAKPLLAALSEAKARARSSRVVEFRGSGVVNPYAAWHIVRARAGLPKSVTPHVLRHTAATLARRGGIPAEDVKYLTGHKTTKVLESTYIHADAEASRSSVEAIEKAFGPGIRKVS